jgi:hypothetical protein
MGAAKVDLEQIVDKRVEQTVDKRVKAKYGITLSNH